MIKYILRLIVAGVVIFIFIKLTTFGWRPGEKYTPIKDQDRKVTGEHLKETVMALSDKIGVRNYAEYQHLKQAEEYITNSFQAMGYEVKEMPYSIAGQTYKNIYVQIKGNGSEELVLVGAHYDSCFNPGADDNASGVAGVLELARMLKEIKPKHNIILAAFVNEEPPFFNTDLMGSRVFAKKLKEQGTKVKAVIILEMIGHYSDQWNSQRYLPLLGAFYPNQGNFITVVGNFPSKHLVGQTVKYFKQASAFPIESIVAPSFIPGIYFSDHASFWKEGYPAVMVTDTAYLRNKNYHQGTDTVETVDFEKMAAVVLGLKGAVIHLVNFE
jgi:Zn-dependent M28 family amino/carboxypeptidase